MSYVTVLDKNMITLIVRHFGHLMPTWKRGDRINLMERVRMK
jgi:hypothetical protein